MRLPPTRGWARKAKDREEILPLPLAENNDGAASIGWILLLESEELWNQKLKTDRPPDHFRWSFRKKEKSY
jgi:hypothetical protein